MYLVMSTCNGTYFFAHLDHFSSGNLLDSGKPLKISFLEHKINAIKLEITNDDICYLIYGKEYYCKKCRAHILQNNAANGSIIHSSTAIEKRD
jgi:hypothetical protein